jgi:aerobic carbon-monoxide dehydrogenase large subunit
MAVTEERTTYIGQPVERKEDAKLLTGQSRFVDDLTLPGMVWAAVVRSPYAHARITSVDLSKAREAEGVVAAFSGADLAEDWKATLPCVWLVTEDTKQPFHRPLATDKARHQGDGVAVVLAESRALAKDAAELVEVEYEPLDPVIDPEAALADGAPLVHEEFGTNHCYTWVLKTDNADSVFADAPVTVKERYRQQRLVPNAMEPRGVLAQHLPAQDEYTLWSATQIPHIARFWLSLTCGIPESKLRVIAPDVGGGFGSKLNVYAEEALALALARRVGRPVKWIEERSEAYLATIHGRDHWQEMELAADEDGKIRGVRVRLTVGLGAYLQLVTAGTPILGAWVYGGAYDVEAYDFECVGAFTTATPTDAYRGAGRPEATYAQARDGSGRAPAQELHHGVSEGHRLRPHDRLRRLPRGARQGAGAARLRGLPPRAGGAARAWRR